MLFRSPPHRPSILRTFLGKITRRAALKKWRDKTRDKRGGGEAALALDELEACVPAVSTVEDESIAAELSKTLNHFISEVQSKIRSIKNIRSASALVKS